ncbi:winged helix-turn-helix domain-containing protein [Yersinia enterocolitica]|uniref:winged helix-turn-helix domain-containing protein n=1 Tax=Yersinia enterocolitica TaxID=630 RepID=UPI001C8DF77D|nr:winged helix-turn-helix domain-containing protein [Yersinia enterocolitica]EKN4180580.1 winged helix-turn-helix transcriptional regulator [Yersinia enterocolitica]MBX9488930.1 winged helix-turn-helix transcriptional regulator [Yersinia enterocolitica]MBX9494231.1 winged helix-turn-helix transcriptional regulator [Yersinia enterocolitica]HEN3447375.1 winged helix-turn-helix transcriptional regulator [Yersinia enterocolitica]
MTNRYFIDSAAVFYPAEKSIISSINGNRIKLNAPTSQLLETFIQNEGVTISQSDLYTIVWGDNGAYVTPNTLYQNISLLRKALKNSGVAGGSLTTIRGKGFLFSAPTVFETKNNDDVNEEGTEHSSRLKFTLFFMLLFVSFLVFMMTNHMTSHFIQYVIHWISSI